MSKNLRRNNHKHGRIIVWGLLGAYPFGGMTWQVLHYLAAFKDLGFEVWYVEETLARSYSARNFSPTRGFRENLNHIEKWMQWMGLENQWVYSPPTNPERYYGALDQAGLKKLYREADAAFNICGAQELNDNNRQVKCRVYVETDPVQKQVLLAEGQTKWISRFSAYDYLFSYAENIGKPDCEIPDSGFEWRTTRPPVYLQWWADSAPPKNTARITSIATWRHKGKDIRWNGQVWRWSKHHGFLEYIDIPKHSKLPIELAVGRVSPQDQLKLESNNWYLSDPLLLSDPIIYRQYIQDSLAEFTVAKEQYVKPKTGWFSDRSVCYLAAARPVITMETGFSKFIPSGEGLFGYSSKEEVWSAIDAIHSDYRKQSARALEIAQEYFNATKIVSGIASEIGLL